MNGQQPNSQERPLRVLSVSPQYYPDLGGVETHVHEVTRRLAPRPDLDITVFASDRSGRLPRSERGEGFDIVRRRAYPRGRDYYFAPGLVRVITGGGWDLVHVQGIHTLVPVVAMLAARRAGVPYVVTFHTGGHSSQVRSSLRDVQWRVLAPLLRGATTLIGVSRFERRLFERSTGIEPSRFTVIRNGGALPPVPADVRPVPGRIVSSGRLERYKGHHRVVEALPHVRAADPAAHLVVLGAGPYEAELRELAASLGVADAVDIRYVQPGDRGAMARELVQASVMAALSDYEAHPVAVMEALTLGVPVVGYDIAGIADLVEDGTVTGLPVGAPPEQAAAALLGAMRPDREPGALVPLDLPTWEDSAQRLAEVYLAAGGRRRAADRLRVVHVATTLTTGGAERQVQYLMRAGSDDSSAVCLYERGLVGDELVAAGARVAVLGMAGWGKATAALRLAAVLRRERPDVVHVHMLSAMLWGIPAARLARVPVIVATEHSIMATTIEGRPKSAPLRAVYLALTRLATRCIAVSGTTAQRMREWGVPAERITVIDNGIDVDALRYSPQLRAAGRVELGVPDGTAVLLAVGRLDPVKRFDVLLAALAPLLRGGAPPAVLVVLGDGGLRPALQAQAAELGVAGAVRLLGPRGDVPRWLSAADVLVSPSRDETFGMAVVEGLAAGLPVVYEQCPALAELAQLPAGAVPVSPDLPAQQERAALLAAVRAALQGPARHEVPSELRDRYGLPALAAATGRLYRELLGAR